MPIANLLLVARDKRIEQIRKKKSENDFSDGILKS